MLLNTEEFLIKTARMIPDRNTYLRLFEDVKDHMDYSITLDKYGFVLYFEINISTGRLSLCNGSSNLPIDPILIRTRALPLIKRVVN